MRRCSCALSCVVLIASFVFAGCSGLVAGNNGNPPPPSTLVITNIQSGSVTTSSSQVVWTTNVPANSSVDYGTSTAYGNSTPVDSAMVMSHQVSLSGLAAGTTYYYQVNSTDSKGNHGHGGNKFNTGGFSLSGTINPTAAGNGATVALSGGASTSATADSSGNYTFVGLANGSYMVTPKHTGYAFTPGNQSATVNGASVTGVNFTATAAPVAPSITTQPASQTVTTGQTASFSVAATGTAPFTYQWQKNSVAISGATSSSYTTPATTTSDNGAQFAVVISNTAGSVTSSAAILTVNAAPVAPSITTQPAGQTVTAGQTASFSVAATGTAPLTYQWQKNSVAIGGATSSSYTTPATTSSDNGAQFTVVVSNTAGSVTSSAAILTVNAAPVAPSITTQPASQTVTSGQTASFSVAATGTAPLTYQWQKNSVAISGATSSNYTTAVTTSSDNGAQFTVVISNTAGNVTSSAAILTVNAAPVAPSITTQPASQTVTSGQTASFSVAATGTAPLSYQWNKNGTAILGATSSSYTTLATTSSDNGAQFTVLVSNSVGSVTSSAATLTVNAAPVAPSITTQPASQTVTAGQTASFSVAATGNAPLTYQWNKNGTAISGATSSGYTTSATTSADNGAQFTVVVSNTAGSVSSIAATLSVNAAPVAPSITAQPAAQTVTAGLTASFSVAATGTAPLGYQWNKNGTAISGATSSSYTTPATTSSDNGAQFTVVVSNTAGSVTSSAAILTVNAAPVAPSITTQPASQTVTAGQTASFSVAATGTAPLSYQWKKNNLAISGATSSGYTTPATTSSDNGALFTVVVSNTAGSVTSIAATLTVNVPQPPSVSITSPGNGASVSGTITMTGTASDAVGLSSVQVQVDGGTFSSAAGTTNWSFTLDTVTLSNAAHTITARATNSSGLSATAAVSVSVSNSGTIINVKNYGATGNGSTNDTTAINSAIAALSSGATLLFPCGTYLTTSQLSIGLSNVTIDGSSCATIHNTGSGTVFVVGSGGNVSPNYGPAVALSTTAKELDTSFTTVSGPGVVPGDYVRLQEGGSAPNGAPDLPTSCDNAGCRGELLKVASVSGNTITVTTALHDAYNPSYNGATAQKLLGLLTGITVKNITFDGNHSNAYGFGLPGVADSTVSGVTSQNVMGSALIGEGEFNVTWSNITVSGAGSELCGSAVWFANIGNVSVNGLTVSNENPGLGGTCTGTGAFGLELIGSANNTLANVTVDATGAYGRVMKTAAARWNTLNSLTLKNSAGTYNGLAMEYWSSHNTFNNCSITNNGVGTGVGTGNAGINLFGNYMQFNTFNNCTVTGNGNMQVNADHWYGASGVNGDDSNAIIGGTYGNNDNSVEPVIYTTDTHFSMSNATIRGPATYGLYIGSLGTNACVNSNTFAAGTGLASAISANGAGDMGSGNVLNGVSSNLPAGTCGGGAVTVTVSPTTANVTSGGTQQFTATVTSSTNTAVTWTASAGSISSSGLFTAPIVSSDTSVTVVATSVADPTKSASASVTVLAHGFGRTTVGSLFGTTNSNTINAARFQMGGQSGTVTSISVYVASPISASANNQFQVAIYSDNAGAPGTLIASSSSQALVGNSWNTVSISASVTPNTYYWLCYNTNGLAANANDEVYDSTGGSYAYLTPLTFGTWPTNFGTPSGTASYYVSIYATYQ
jgi:hypothetical protein